MRYRVNSNVMHYGYYLLAAWSFITIMVALVQPMGLPPAVKMAIVLFIITTAALTWISRNMNTSKRSGIVLAVWGSGITALTTIDMLIDFASMMLAGVGLPPFAIPYIMGSYMVVILSWYGARVGMTMKQRWLGGTIMMLCLIVGCSSFIIRDFLTYD